jgi:hypothetical protein
MNVTVSILMVVQITILFPWLNQLFWCWSLQNGRLFWLLNKLWSELIYSLDQRIVYWLNSKSLGSLDSSNIIMLEYFLIFCGLQSIIGFGFNKSGLMLWSNWWCLDPIVIGNNEFWTLILICLETNCRSNF